MSTRGTKKKGGRSAARQKSRAFYLYCIGESGQLRPLIEGETPGAIETGARIEMIEASGLAAIASEVPLDDYGEDALAERLGDPSWTALRAIRHEQVAEHFARLASVIPLRFGTIYTKRERVEQMLSENREGLLEIINRLRGREEWGVNVYVKRAALKEAVTTISPRLRELGERAAAASPGQAYLIRKEIEALRADEARAQTRRVTAEIERELARFGAASARLRVTKDEASEHGEVAAKLVFLVPRSGFDEFRAAAEKMAEQYAASGFKLELTGPWPGYNFADHGKSQT
ncbi:MAG TPA: GvpL/GvpF family gas vesicle protein [Blastocatellia bacterium]|nr:GvpL/GvpF family gas vesicle protein [Blastocatellia bacterium]